MNSTDPCKLDLYAYNVQTDGDVKSQSISLTPFVVVCWTRVTTTRHKGPIRLISDFIVRPSALQIDAGIYGGWLSSLPVFLGTPREFHPNYCNMSIKKKNYILQTFESSVYTKKKKKVLLHFVSHAAFVNRVSTDNCSFSEIHWPDLHTNWQKLWHVPTLQVIFRYVIYTRPIVLSFRFIMFLQLFTFCAGSLKILTGDY